jgi:hypothetical protein
MCYGGKLISDQIIIFTGKLILIYKFNNSIINLLVSQVV